MQNSSFPKIFDLVRRLLSVLLAGAVLAAPLSSHAQPDATAPAQASASAESAAKTKFADALKLYKSGSFAEALPLFRDAAETTGSPNAQLYVGYCLARLGKRVDAHRAFALLLKQIAEHPDEKYRPTGEAAEAQLATLNVRLAKIVILVTDAPPDVAVTLDGVAVEEKTLGSSIVVEPGTHRVEVSASGQSPVRRDISLDGGELKTLHLSLRKTDEGQPERGPGPAAAAPPAPVAATAARAPKKHPIRTAGYVSGAVGVAGLAVFAVTGLMTKATYDRLRRECGAAGCSEAGQLDDIDRGKSLQTIANVGLVVGAIGIVAGGTMIMLDSGKSKETQASVWLSPGVGMVSCGGTF